MLVFALIVLAVFASAWGNASAATGKYGKPLRFDPPPVDTGNARQADLPEPSPPLSGPGEAAGDGAARPDGGEGAGGDASGLESGTQAAQPAATAANAAASTSPIRLFGTVEFRSPIKNLPKWERVMGSEKRKPSFIDKGMDTRNQQVSARWAKLKEKLQGASLREKVQGVNNFFNQWPYKTDREVWGVEDYWAVPREFVEKSGDCEDYAISKYYALRDLGVPAEMMRIAAIKDVIRNLGHAVLVVFMESDAYVLDNLTNLVLSHKKLTHYAPQYTVNETFLWRHVKPKSTPAK